VAFRAADELGGGELALGGVEHAGTGLVRALVGARDPDAIVVGLAERGLCSLSSW
jgi:hypothetical protein